MNDTKQNALLIDIVIAVADQGGVEQIINSFAEYLSQRSVTVRVIQMVWEHHPWTVPQIEFHYIYDDRNNQSMQSFAAGYQHFLEAHEKPDLILATAWPVMVMAARLAVQNLGLSIRIASWMHAPLSRYKAAGYGDEMQLKYADIHFAISQTIADEISSLLPNAYIYRVNNPYDRKQVRDIPRGDERTILFVGRLSEEKNIPLLLSALQRSVNDGWRLVIIGDGPEMDNLKEDVTKMGLQERVTFLGWQERPWFAVKEAALLVVSSLYEGGSLVALEALACGIPVAGTPVGYLPEIISPGVNGWLFENGDTDTLVQILHYIATGSLIIPSPDTCKQSVSMFEKEKAFEDFMNKLKATCENRILIPALYH